MNSREREMLLAIADVATPGGEVLAAPTDATVDAVIRLLDHGGPGALHGYRMLLRFVNWSTLPTHGRALQAMDRDARSQALIALNDGPTHWAVRALVAPLKLTQASQPKLLDALDAPAPRRLPMMKERARWHAQVIDARDLDDGHEIEVDAVVVGTGAGGAPVAYSLAKQGYAVLMLEEGGHHTRESFNGDPMAMHRLLYRDRGLTAAFGNTLIPVPLGRGVGGTTTINSGTCLRVEPRVQRRWQLEQGLDALRPGTLDGYYDEVERMLEVAPTPEEVLGGVARVIARGAAKLGYAHGPLDRNAPGCDGQGVCVFGCPTDAKRSTNVSYVPAALERGAMVYTHARVTRVLRHGGRARGVTATVEHEDGRRSRVTVRAKAVVLSCGSIQTPALLLENGLANRSDQVGRNLTIHPASHGFAAFEEDIRGWNAVPQGYGIHEFVDQGIRFEGGFLPPSYAAAFLGQIGPRWTRLTERFDRLAQFGFMIEDSARGRVTLNGRGRPRMSYWLADEDRLKMIRAHAILARVYLAAGAHEVIPGLQHFDRLTSEDDVRRLEREGPGRLAVHHIDVSAYHPLGTCRMGVDPSSSVVDANHMTHDIEDLFIADGSVVSGPLGVNPQVTIMAMAHRAADRIAERLDRRHTRALVAPAAQLAFTETMAGHCELLRGDDAGQEVDLAFHVTAALPTERPTLSTTLRRGSVWQLSGTVEWGDVVAGARCHGTLAMRPWRGRAGLVYELRFEDEVGTHYRLHGEKHLSLLQPVSGMTTLYTEIWDTDEAAVVARGVLRFDLGDLRPWLASWRAPATPLPALEADAVASA